MRGRSEEWITVIVTKYEYKRQLAPLREVKYCRE
jgi:hypothetical protein